MSTKITFAALVFLLVIVTACRNPESIRIKLTSMERALIDTLYLEKVSLLRPHWDSICASTHDSLLEIALDSIIKVRRAEEIKLRSRIPIPTD